MAPRTSASSERALPTTRVQSGDVSITQCPRRQTAFSTRSAHEPLVVHDNEPGSTHTRSTHTDPANATPFAAQSVAVAH